jgi:hypothetical protein
MFERVRASVLVAAITLAAKTPLLYGTVYGSIRHRISKGGDMSATAHQAVRVEPDPIIVTHFEADYADAFRIEGVPGTTARSWTDASLHGSDARRGLFRTLVWHGLLRFDLAGDDEAGTAFGWRISIDENQRVVLDTDGSLAAGRMVFVANDDATTWTTMLRYHHPLARYVWAVLSKGHRAIAPSCLDRASINLRRTPRRVAAGRAAP